MLYTKHRVRLALCVLFTAISLAAVARTVALAAPELSTLPDYELLARNALLEAGGGSDEEQQAVIQAALNRLAWGAWGGTLYEVLSAPGQFSTWRNMGCASPTEKEYRNVLAVLTAEEPYFPGYVMYYRAERYHEWAEQYAKIGGTYFGYLEEDRKKYAVITNGGMNMELALEAARKPGRWLGLRTRRPWRRYPGRRIRRGGCWRP